jgi:5'(3')-deoxyribonucleotidase/uncharacterized protein with PQ loop repeat
MQMRSAAAILGTVAAILSTVAFVPQIMKIWRTGGKDVSFFMLSLYVMGVTLWLCYGLAIGATALSLANAVSIVFAGTCLVLKLMKERQTPVRIEKKPLRIAIDMDETIADSLKEQIRRYNVEFAEMVSTDDLYGKHLEEYAPFDRREAVRSAVRDDSFFDCLDVIDGSKQVIEELVREHEVYIVSAAMEIPESLAAKHRWLRRHFPFVPQSNVVFCGNKGIINADYLIDDEARHFVGFPGTGILFSAPHNLSETEHRRVQNWRDVYREFMGLRNIRDFGEARLMGRAAHD